MVFSDMNQAEVTVYDKVREYYRVDKKLGGLIKVFVSLRVEKIGRTVEVYFSNLDRYDEVKVNGVKYVPEKDES